MNTSSFWNVHVFNNEIEKEADNKKFRDVKVDEVDGVDQDYLDEQINM